MNQTINQTKRANKAIRKNIEIGGRFFCFHDWVIGAMEIPNDHLYCVKCGKYKSAPHGSIITKI